LRATRSSQRVGCLNL